MMGGMPDVKVKQEKRRVKTGKTGIFFLKSGAIVPISLWKNRSR